MEIVYTVLIRKGNIATLCKGQHGGAAKKDEQEKCFHKVTLRFSYG